MFSRNFLIVLLSKQSQLEQENPQHYSQFYAGLIWPSIISNIVPEECDSRISLQYALFYAMKRQNLMPLRSA
jgi:hypothetical protein